MIDQIIFVVRGLCAHSRHFAARAIRATIQVAFFTIRMVISVGFISSFCVLSGQSPQALVDLGRQTRNADFSTFPFTRPAPTGSALPVACQVGQWFFAIPAIDNSFLWLCTTQNVWTSNGGKYTVISGSVVSAGANSAGSTKVQSAQ
jgi:hypothetical protein